MTNRAQWINSYDEYGIPASGNKGRFGYTGQIWLPTTNLWHAQARTYSPTLGRFLQTDPIGYGDGLNWYNYVGGDPVNGIDPTGTQTCLNTGPTSSGGSSNSKAVNNQTCFDSDRSGGAAPAPAGGGDIGEVVVTAQQPPVAPPPPPIVPSVVQVNAGAPPSLPGVATGGGAAPQNPQPDCNTRLPNGKTVGDAVRGAVQDTLTPGPDVGSNTDAAADIQGKMAMYTFPYGPLDFKNLYRGRGDPTSLAAAGNFAYGA